MEDAFVKILGCVGGVGEEEYCYSLLWFIIVHFEFISNRLWFLIQDKHSRVFVFPSYVW